MSLKKLFFALKIILLSLFISQETFSNSNVYIKYKIENEIITNLDIVKEQQYLIALNNNLKNLSENEISELAKNYNIYEYFSKKFRIRN